MAITYRWQDMPLEVEALTRRLNTPGLPEAAISAARARRRELVAALRCEFGLSPLARLSTVEQMERLGMLVGPEQPPYAPLAWEDTETDRRAYLRANDRPASGGMGRWKFVTLGGGLVYPGEIEAALAAVPPEEHQRVAQQVVWWPGYLAFLREAETHRGFFT